MVAKAYTVSRSGVKREVPSPKATARERLLKSLDGLTMIPPSEAYARRVAFLRLLRAHERELAERVIALKLHCTCRASNAACPRNAAVRAAILGPAVTRKRGTR